MKIRTLSIDGTVTWYAFDPGPREEIIAFYEDLKATGEIINYHIMAEGAGA